MTHDTATPHATAGDGSNGSPDGLIAEQRIERELQDSYLTYAMSTIMDRALPDIRDGLKPSQRRILVAMNDLNLTPGRRHIKCAKVAGDTSGNYHPHGESVIYPTLVRMGQDWSLRCPLIDKQGNFGSIDGDPPAAMRYTEARMTAVAVEMMQDLKLDTVDMQPNYDGRLDEPTVLPAKLPNLLVNGAQGIAVGMASSMPPHNLREICNGIIAVIDNPDIGLMELMEIVPGPDFPTGGVICGRHGIAQGYATGRSKLTVRGRLHQEQFKTGRLQLVIDEIPYGIVQRTIIEKIVSAVRDGKIRDISSVRNESGRKARTRIVIELKRAGDPDVVEKQLYEYTPLQSTFSIMNVALVNRQPRTLGLKALMQGYVDHRIIVIRRRTQHLLKEAQKKAHILEALIYAVFDIDEVIRLIRSSQTRADAIEKLTERRFRLPPDHPYAPRVPQRLKEHVAGFDAQGGVALTRVQAEAIGRMQLIQLVGLEIEKLARDYTQVVEEMEGYEAILDEHERVLDIIREDLRELATRYGTDRLTEIGVQADDLDIADLIQEEEMAVIITHHAYVMRLTPDTYRTQNRGGMGVNTFNLKEDDFIEYIFVASTHDDLLCFTNTGRVFKIKVYQVPQMSRTSMGRAIVNLLKLREGETVRAFLPIKDFEKSESFLTFATTGGRVKRTLLKDYRNVNVSGIIAINLREGDQLLDVTLTTGSDDLLLATRRGMAIRFGEDDVRVMGRSAAGVRGIALGDGDEVVGLVRIDEQETAAHAVNLVTLTENGYGKQTPLREYLVQSETGPPRTQSRGGKGRIDIRTTQRNGQVVAAMASFDDADVMLVSQDGKLTRIPLDSISVIGRATQGVRVVRLRQSDKLIAATCMERSSSAVGSTTPEDDKSTQPA
ncbi:MAG: DNA gyrase subunit A [Phycisphaerales bacterium]|nr:DNA gyrase subunit A [Phycisphaerales bacterium]